MQNLSVSEAQKQFTKLFSTTTIIIDKKSYVKKADLLPYETYKKLLAVSKSKQPRLNFDSFEGVLSKDFETDDVRYQEIVK